MGSIREGKRLREAPSARAGAEAQRQLFLEVVLGPRVVVAWPRGLLISCYAAKGSGGVIPVLIISVNWPAWKSVQSD